jgi:UDP-glucose 4-epimerase
MISRFYKGKKVLVTGGTGFIGGNLAYRLVSMKVPVTILAHSESHLSHIQDVIEMAKNNAIPFEIIIGDLRDSELMQKIVKGKDIIFNLAAKVSHMDKGVVSYEDLDINVRGQLTLLEALRLHNPKAKVIFSSTRMVYGENVKNPVKETHPTNPTTLYGINKLMAEKYHLAYHKRYGLRVTILRIGNPYGDRQHFSSGLYSLPGWFMNRALNGETIEILSDGKQERDYIYIGDLIEIMLRAGMTEKTDGKIYNAGSGIRKTFGEMVDAIWKTVKSGKFVYVEKPQSTKNDSYVLDISALTKDLKWKPKTKLNQGLKKMLAYAKKNPKK